MWGCLLNEKMKGKNDVDIQIKWKMELSETLMEEKHAVSQESFILECRTSFNCCWSIIYLFGNKITEGSEGLLLWDKIRAKSLSESRWWVNTCMLGARHGLRRK